MKWRPISELSDEQRDGRWVLFAKVSEFSCVYKEIQELCWARGSGGMVGWFNENDILQFTNDEINTYDYFLSEPLPDLPKPQKMEWRKFEDEMPEEDQLILVHHLDDKTFYKSFGKCDNKAYTYWMPIIPPEDN